MPVKSLFENTNPSLYIFKYWSKLFLKKQIWNDKVHISIVNFFFKSFGQYLKKWKKWISHCIFKKSFDRRRVHILAKIFSEKLNFPKDA